MTGLELVLRAMRNLGGVAHATDIYREVGRIKGRRLNYNDRAGVRKLLYLNSSDSEAWQSRADLFFSADGIRSGVWGLRRFNERTPKANDLTLNHGRKGSKSPQRVSVTVNRIVRDTAIGRIFTQRTRHFHQSYCRMP